MDLPSLPGGVSAVGLLSMNTRLLVLFVITLFLGFSRPLVATDAPAAANKPGYNVVLDIVFDEKGVPESANVVESDYPTRDTVLNRVAMALAN